MPAGSGRPNGRAPMTTDDPQTPGQQPNLPPPRVLLLIGAAGLCWAVLGAINFSLQAADKWVANPVSSMALGMTVCVTVAAIVLVARDTIIRRVASVVADIVPSRQIVYAHQIDDTVDLLPTVRGVVHQSVTCVPGLPSDMREAGERLKLKLIHGDERASLVRHEPLTPPDVS